MDYLMHTYNRYPVTIDRGEGVYLYDTEGKRYLDFMAGIAVFAFGYHNEAYNNALKDQIDKIIHTSNLFYHEPAAKAAEKLCRASGMDRVFFTNSGTEAIEGAVKLARKYAYVNRKGKEPADEIISMRHSFHGRSTGALAVTGNPRYQEAFRPLMGGVVFADFNDLDSVKRAVTEKTCAILLEPVQGEGGIYPASREFLKGVRALCDEYGILLILDEIQCGMGRTGTMFAYEQYGIKPDILAAAKALGCGMPVGAFAATEQVANAFEPGDHGTTYGGNPLAAAAVSQVFDLFKEADILSHVRELAPYLEQRLLELKEKYPCISKWRGLGLMQGLEFTEPVAPVIQKALEKGLVLIAAGSEIIRFVPPLVIERTHVDEMIEKLDASIQETIGKKVCEK